jgi:hypothetical protein
VASTTNWQAPFSSLIPATPLHACTRGMGARSNSACAPALQLVEHYSSAALWNSASTFRRTAQRRYDLSIGPSVELCILGPWKFRTILSLIPATHPALFPVPASYNGTRKCPVSCSTKERFYIGLDAPPLHCHEPWTVDAVAITSF